MCSRWDFLINLSWNRWFGETSRLIWWHPMQGIIFLWKTKSGGLREKRVVASWKLWLSDLVVFSWYRHEMEMQVCQQSCCNFCCIATYSGALNWELGLKANSTVTSGKYGSNAEPDLPLIGVCFLVYTIVLHNESVHENSIKPVGRIGELLSFGFLFGAWDLMLCTFNCMYIF